MRTLGEVEAHYPCPQSILVFPLIHLVLGYESRILKHMKCTELAGNCLVHVHEFQSQTLGKGNDEADGIMARWCCEQLEESRILFFESLPFDFPEEDRNFLISQQQGDSHL